VPQPAGQQATEAQLWLALLVRQACPACYTALVSLLFEQGSWGQQQVKVVALIKCCCCDYQSSESTTLVCLCARAVHAQRKASHN